MADTRQRTTWGNRFRFLIRAVGLTGVVAVAVGGALSATTLPAFDVTAWLGWESLADQLRAAAEGAHGETAKVAAWLVAGGAAAVALALIIELLGALFLGAGRRTVAGTTATVGAVAAVVLLVAVNLYSFSHYRRYDCTRDERFTLSPQIADEMRKLRAGAPTTIVVLHKHKMFGNLTDVRDSYTSEAERKVTEKVKDLVDLFREFGPRFKVAVLDTASFEYEEQLAELTKDAPELKSAIEAAPENSILFHANKRVQRLAFNEFMQLDRSASKEANGGKANLVLLPQGADTFARRVLAVQERRPKVAVCVVHELLTTAADDPKNRFTMAGLRKSLTSQGFDVVDIVLKKGWSGARSLSDLKPAADTREESKLERLEGELDDADTELMSARAEVRQFEAIREAINKVKGRPWDERKALYQRIFRGTITEEIEPQLLAAIDRRARRAQDEATEAAAKKQEAEKQLAEAMKDERPIQDRRMSDVSAKFTKQLADVDLLIIPRYTTEDAMKGPGVEAGLHALSKEQTKVAKEFMKQGKPVLACLGPITPQVDPQPGETQDEFDKRLTTELAGGVDEFEKMLAERGIELGRTVVLFDGETKALTRGGQFGSSPSEVPPLTLAEPPADATLKPNPIAASFRLTARTVGNALDLKIRAIRPVNLAPGWQAKQPFAAEFAFTASDSWNDLQPFPRLDRAGRPISIPKYAPTGLDDPKRGTPDEERRGPFPLAVAIENKIPAAWVNEDYQRQQVAAALLTPFDGTLAVGLTVAAEKLQRPTQRTVVFGSGNLFTASKLEPPEEKLLLHTVNWLTAREDRLPKAEGQWQYPRVEMSERERTLWRFGTFLGLPAVAAYIGLLVMMVRRLR